MNPIFNEWNKPLCNHCGYLETIVRDSGIGIDQDHLAHIFEIFGNIDANECGIISKNGIGLGL